MKQKRLIIVNQAANYLTVGLANAFAEQMQHIVLITGGVHTQGEELSEKVKMVQIAKFRERPVRMKLYAYLVGTIQIYLLLLLRFRRYEVFFFSNPPMAYLLNVILPNKCSLLVWDIYPELFKVTGMSERHLLFRAWSYLNKISFKKAHKLFTISEKMASLLSSYVESEKIIVSPIWSIFQENNRLKKDENPFIREHNLDSKFIVQYSGNIGLTHNVETMIELAELLSHRSEIRFQIIGRGPRKAALQKMVEQRALSNCSFLSFQSDDMFPYSLSAADIGVVILDDLVSKGSVPSKALNLMSYGIPSLYIASEDSELHSYAKKYKNGECFSSKDLNHAAKFIVELSTYQSKWEEYSRHSIAASMHFKRKNADDIVLKYLS